MCSSLGPVSCSSRSCVPVVSAGSTADCDRSCGECSFVPSASLAADCIDWPVANVTGKATVEGEGDFQVQEFNFKLKKVDRTWLIYRIDTVKTLSRTTALPPSHA